MTIKEIQDEILRLKQENDFCILAHSYVDSKIQEIADFTGDSYGLSLKAKGVKNKNILMCGVRFMAETCKMLSPEKHVYLSSPVAGCPMAEQMDKKMIQEIKLHHPDYTVVCYVNTTAELKTVCDVCVTSSSAVKIVSQLSNDKILFIPDCNLGSYVQEQLPDKKLKLLDGGCPIHGQITKKEAQAAKNAHPNALLLVHPECKPEISAMADYAGSTTGIIDFARKSDAKEFIIGTEISITEILQNEMPEKRFYPMNKKMICENMKATTLMDVYHCVKDFEGEEMLMDEETIVKARVCIDRMIALGG